jgi:hypothetical protein
LNKVVVYSAEPFALNVYSPDVDDWRAVLAFFVLWFCNVFLVRMQGMQKRCARKVNHIFDAIGELRREPNGMIGAG